MPLLMEETMPNINRIRVNNVKYNFGTQGYDDFSMRMYGKNTLYDLANGGGKSVLMLLLLQNLIPNCTLDEKQPIEKLFRTGGGNTTIHSLVEWKLDDKDIKEGYRYMTTGFCARKAKENDTEQDAENQESPLQKENASIEYFNYCIFYRDYNENDIINLPLQNNKERITYTGLKNYLKDLSHKNLNIRVHVFERKGEYQRFISKYGLYESQWEIIRGINKTEGHVRTYFETHYKTTRKVVEDLLIEEIIEKAFLVKTEQNDVNEDMAKTLLDIKDKLVELSKKKSDIANFDKETELMHLLEGRVSSFLSLYEEKDRVTGTLADIYMTGQVLSEKGKEEIAAMEEEESLLEQKLMTERKRLESLKIVKDQYDLSMMKEDIKVLEQHVSQAQKEYRDAQKELDLKESINDYLHYLKEQAQVEENQAMIDAAVNQNGDYRNILLQYAYIKKQLDDINLKEIRQQLQQKQEELEQTKQKLQTALHVAQEGEISYAVAQSHKEQLEKDYNKKMEELRLLRKDISVLVLSDLSQLQETLAQQEAEFTQQKQDRKDSYVSGLQQLKEKEQLLYTKNQELSKTRERLADIEKNFAEYVQNQDRLKKMQQVYGVKESSLLYSAIKERAFSNQVSIVNLEREMEAINRHLVQVAEGRILEESEAVTKVKAYLETRHGDFALSGVDYLSALPKVNKEELLNRFPMLPYGVVTGQFELVENDERIQTIDLGSYAVPIFDKSVLESPYIPAEEKGVLLVAKEQNSFLEEEALSREETLLKKKLSEKEEEQIRLKELQETYNEDLDYTARLTDAAFINSEQELNACKESVLELTHVSEQCKEEIQYLTNQNQQYENELETIEQQLAQTQKEQIKLAKIMAISDAADEMKTQLDYYTAQVRRLDGATKEAKQQSETIKLQEEDIRRQVEHLSDNIEKTLVDWNTIYKEYYDPSVNYNITNIKDIDEDKLRAEFLAAKAVVEQETIVLEDKKKLIETLKASMERDRRIIDRRQIPFEVLENMHKNKELHPVEEEFMNRMSMHLSQIAVRVDQLGDEYKQKEHEATRIEGRIEQAMISLKENFGESAMNILQSFEGEGQISKEEALQAIAEGDRVLKQLKANLKEYHEKYQRYVKNHSVMVDLYKDIRRIVENEAIDTKNANVLVYEQDKLREIFEDSLLDYDKCAKNLARARQELYNYKTQTANTFFTMGAFELSNSIKDDVEIPEQYSEAKTLLDNIREMISYIELEKERVLKGIEDMEAIKNNFENQCIERCKDVRTELEKLPKLSRIMLDGEMIQMVNLTIPYVKDEFIKQRMSDYIDEVVKGADRFKDNNERMKYIKNHLLLKKLFGVMVTDMNAIRLKLYKRERMKEQSRYLRYEEAVGSTGQSQGIYIQFLVSIINYIAGMYAPEAESNELKKVIFIDNPFGAAKDIYIWEPIFALLQTNNVQLIVPARGATPAITNRFDVNYILGQQLVNGRQQTVVVDYRSQVVQDEVEYQNLEYTQGTLSFL